MHIQPIFYAIFYDMEKPKTIKYAMHKRIDASIYRNLTDDNGIKEVELKDHEGNVSRYRIPSMLTFKIENSIECNLYVVCNCEKIK